MSENNEEKENEREKEDKKSEDEKEIKRKLYEWYRYYPTEKILAKKKTTKNGQNVLETLSLLVEKDWTSGNEFIDKFIQETQTQGDNKLRWIPYDRLENIEYLDKGGFSTIYKATLSDTSHSVILKSFNSFNNSNESTNEFLNEWKYHNKCQTNNIIQMYGFTKDPNTSNYMVVMDYAEKGSLRKYLPELVKRDWKYKLEYLGMIIEGINQIHQQNLIHHDLHDGNVLNYKKKACISDLGLCRPVESSLEKSDTYGVLPFMAPEVLRGKPYTTASDIYSFAMIMWEFTSGVPPFNGRAHDLQLCLNICRGERPKIIENTPQCYINLIEKCWNKDPSKRPSALEVSNTIEKWIRIKNIEEIGEELKDNILEFIKDNPTKSKATNNKSDKPITKSHPQAYHTSRLLDYTRYLNNILEQEEKKEDISANTYEIGISKNIEDLIITEEDMNEDLKEIQSDKKN